MSRDPDIQLRFPYQAPLKAQRLRLRLRGLVVLAVPEDGDVQSASAHLQAAGLRVEVDEIGLVSFSVADLKDLLELPSRVTLLPEGDLRVLLAVLRATGPHDTVIVSQDSQEVLNLSWVDPTGECNEPLNVSSAAALLALCVPMVADPATWELIHRASSLPVVRAQARLNLDGFIEITTSVAQHVESFPVRGLFRVDESRFGVPLPCIDELDRIPGLYWDGPRPASVASPPRLRDIPLVLSSASRAQLKVLVDKLARTRAQAVVWPRGAGRRVFCMAAMESLDALPLLVLCMPSMLWVWHRHLDLLGRRIAVTDPLSDVRVVPYDLLAQVDVGAPAGIVFDDLDVALQRDQATIGALRRFDGGVDTIRLACSSSLPQNESVLTGYFSALRPVEFRSDLPAATRYTPPVRDHLRRHTEIYVLGPHAQPAESGFRRSRVETVEQTAESRRAESALESMVGASLRSRRERAELLLRWSEEGPPDALSPKLSRTVALVREQLAAGATVTVLVGSSRAATLIRSLVRPADPAALRVEVGVPSRGRVCETDVAIVAVALRSFDVLDEFVVDASDSRGPQLVVVLHVRDSIEDRLAVVAALRSERARTIDPAGLLTEREIDYLLGLAPAPVG